MLLAAFIGLTSLVVALRWSDPARRDSAWLILLGLLAMVPPHNDLWEFGVWVGVAYAVDIASDDVAPGTLLVGSALFYPLSALGFSPWWCQAAANVLGLVALGCVYGMGGGILADYRYRRPSGCDFLGIVWRSSASPTLARAEEVEAPKEVR